MSIARPLIPLRSRRFTRLQGGASRSVRHANDTGPVMGPDNSVPIKSIPMTPFPIVFLSLFALALLASRGQFRFTFNLRRP